MRAVGNGLMCGYGTRNIDRVRIDVVENCGVEKNLNERVDRWMRG